MPGSATDYLETKALQHFLRIAVAAQPAGIFLALCTTIPSDTAAGTEVVGGAYARQPCTFAMVGGQAGAAANTATVDYPVATANWGTITHLEIWDAVTAGNRLWYGPLVDPSDGVTPISRQILTGDILRLQAGAIVVTAD